MGLDIRPFTLGDVPFGMALTDAEGWGRLPEDWTRLVRLEPGGAFKAVLDGRDVGTTAAVAFGPCAFLHSVIVRKECRGRGIADALMRACLGYLRSRGVRTIKLDSVRGVEPFYARFGFRAEFPSHRFLGEGRRSRVRVAPLRPADWRDVLLFDRKSVGLDRGRALEAILRDYPYESFLVRRGGQVRGYAIVRRGRPTIPIGPCVVGDGDTALARDLLEAALSTTNAGRFRVCVGGCNGAAVKLFDELGFARGEPSTRMALGEPFEESRDAFAMLSAEKG